MTLDHATCARLPAEGLATLAGLRRSEGISVVLEGETAWVFWEPGDGRVLRAVLPVAGVELFEKRGDAWHRAGRRLPSFEEVPPGGEPVPLARAVTPAPFLAAMPGPGESPSLPLRLARDGRPRPTSAALCPLVELGRWVDSAPSAAIASIRGALRGDSALLIGPGLPSWRGATRYWGVRLLVPIGFEVRPDLPEATILEALGDPARELLRVVVVPDGGGNGGGDGLAVEAIPLEAFRPLTRAGVRLALGGGVVIMINAVVAYLRIPDDYDGNRYSLSWAPRGDAVERPDGSTFVVSAGLAMFLEGYASVGPLIHFSYILYLLQRFDSRLLEPDEPGLPTTGPGRELVEKSDSLASAFRKAGQPFRKAGALCAWLCRDIPPVVSPPDPLELCLRLSNGALMSELAIRRVATAPLAGEVDVPPLNALDFEMRFLNALKKLDPVEIACWLDHGRGPLPDPGRRVAEAIVALKPRTLEGALAALSSRDRLSGAVPMVAQLVAALSLPPRRLAHSALPTGGYADVATRGRPEQILPSQFAVDDIEFLRRFAENELLYFHREEPHAPLTEELVLVLDQGVRTWGRVRHALNASALAFGKLAARRKLGLRVASTGSMGRLFDPLRVDDETLGMLWEASDLSPDPGEALGQVLEESGAARRDVVVLSHPRSVAGADFAAATRRSPDGTRVFSVAIDEPGHVQFREWRRGVPIKVGDFRVDFAPPSAGPAGKPGGPRGADPRGWRGDVEPVPFPFRFGVTHRIERPLFDFDHAARWLLLCTYRGMLHAWKLDGTGAEVLPRAMVEGEVLEQVDAVVGVLDGFVIGGRIGKTLVAMHYDLGSRTARAYDLGPTFDGEWLWFYSKDVHTVVARGRTYSRAVDLSVRAIYRSRDSKERPPIRAIRAFEAASNHFVPPPRLPVVDDGSPEPIRGGFVRLDWATGEVHVARVAPPWEPFTPTADGKPSLKNCHLDYAQLRGNVLALLISHPDRKPKTWVQLFRGPDGVPTRELAPLPDPQALILSSDGHLIARRQGERQVEVRETAGPDHPLFVTTKGKTHSDPRVTLGRYGMLIHVGKHVSLIRWDGDKLTISTVAEGSTRSEHDVVTWPLDRPATAATPPPAHLRNQHRFVACARAELTAVVDVFGQIALFDRSDRLVAMFLAFRGQVAAWTPDGTRFGPTQGPSPLIDGPVTRNAAEKIGRSLKDATDAAPSRP